MIADELDDLADEEADFALDELELLMATEELLLDELLDEALDATTRTEDEELAALEVTAELTAAELVLLDELEATGELVDGGGRSAAGGLDVSVPAPPPHALNTKAATNTSERD